MKRFLEKAILWVGVATGAALTFLILTPANPGHASSVVTIGVQAGVSARVTTLQCYDPDPFTVDPYHAGAPNPWGPCRSIDDSPPDGVSGTHSGSATPVDFGAGSGSATRFQNAYLPAAVSGGYVYMQDASAGCFSYTGSQYNGKRTQLWVYYYDGGGLTDQHDVYYAHIDQVNLNTWFTWNNYSATSWLWPSWAVNYWMNNGASGGMPTGSVATFGTSVPAGCATHPHLHQETGGSHSEAWNPYLASEGCLYTGVSPQSPCTASGYAWFAGDSATQSVTDTQYVHITLH